MATPAEYLDSIIFFANAAKQCLQGDAGGCPDLDQAEKITAAIAGIEEDLEHLRRTPEHREWDRRMEETYS